LLRDIAINMKSQHFWFRSLGLNIMLSWEKFDVTQLYSFMPLYSAGKIIKTHNYGKIKYYSEPIPNPVITSVISPWNIHIVVFMGMTQWTVV